MLKKTSLSNNRHLLITVSDKQGTRHYRFSRFIKPLLIGTSLSLITALIASNILLFNQHRELVQGKTQSESFEDAFVKLSAKNSLLNQTLERERGEKEELSAVLTELEKTSGVSSGIDSSLVDRFSAISDHFSGRELDFAGRHGRVTISEDGVAPDQPRVEGENTNPQDGFEFVSLNINQQEILHDSVPNGYPTGDTGVSNKFGMRVHPDTRQSSFHNGIDLVATVGTEVFATADGIIKDAAYNKLSGKRIVLSHNLGFETRYAHLSEMKVSNGDVVQKGDLIALTGNTGRSADPKLHYEIRYLDKPHNPIDFVNWEFGNQEIFTNVRGIQWHSLISLINKQISRPTLQLSQVIP